MSETEPQVIPRPSLSENNTHQTHPRGGDLNHNCPKYIFLTCRDTFERSTKASFVLGFSLVSGHPETHKTGL